jgi:hypothetical protein
MAKIPIVGHHRGVPLHDQQPEARLAVVRAEIDCVLDRIEDVGALYRFAADQANSPESRLLASAKIQGIWQLRAESREARPPGVTLEKVRAVVAGLNSEGWRDRHHYCSLLDIHEPGPGPRRAVKRERELPDKRPAPATALEPAEGGE